MNMTLRRAVNKIMVCNRNPSSYSDLQTCRLCEYSVIFIAWLQFLLDCVLGGLQLDMVVFLHDTIIKSNKNKLESSDSPFYPTKIQRYSGYQRGKQHLHIKEP